MQPDERRPPRYGLHSEGDNGPSRGRRPLTFLSDVPLTQHGVHGLDPGDVKENGRGRPPPTYESVAARDQQKAPERGHRPNQTLLLLHTSGVRLVTDDPLEELGGPRADTGRLESRGDPGRSSRSVDPLDNMPRLQKRNWNPRQGRNSPRPKTRLKRASSLPDRIDPHDPRIRRPDDRRIRRPDDWRIRALLLGSRSPRSLSPRSIQLA